MNPDDPKEDVEFKKPRQCKEPTAQLLVLPPELLLKLGISLDANDQWKEDAVEPISTKATSSERGNIKKLNLQNVEVDKTISVDIKSQRFAVPKDSVQITNIQNKSKNEINKLIKQKLSPKHDKVTQNSLTKSLKKAKNYSKCINNKQPGKESSILETSNLVKESVLLSPSFIEETTDNNTNECVKNIDTLAPAARKLLDKNTVLQPSDSILSKLLSMPIKRGNDSKEKRRDSADKPDTFEKNTQENLIICTENRRNLSKNNSIAITSPIKTTGPINQIVNNETNSSASRSNQTYALPEDLHIVDAEVDIIDLRPNIESDTVSLDNTAVNVYQDEQVGEINVQTATVTSPCKTKELSGENINLHKHIQNMEFSPICDDNIDEAYSSDSVNDLGSENFNEMWDESRNRNYKNSCDSIDCVGNRSMIDISLHGTNYSSNKNLSHTLTEKPKYNNLVCESLNVNDKIITYGIPAKVLAREESKSINTSSRVKLMQILATTHQSVRNNSNIIDESESDNLQMLYETTNLATPIEIIHQSYVRNEDSFENQSKCTAILDQLSFIKSNSSEFSEKNKSYKYDKSSDSQILYHTLNTTPTSLNTTQSNLSISQVQNKNVKYVPIIAEYLKRAMQACSLKKQNQKIDSLIKINFEETDKNTQGVEKPGGMFDIQHRKASSTYSNMKRILVNDNKFKINFEECDLKTCTNHNINIPIVCNTFDLHYTGKESQVINLDYSLPAYFGQCSFNASVDDIELPVWLNREFEEIERFSEDAELFDNQLKIVIGDEIVLNMSASLQIEPEFYGYAKNAIDEINIFGCKYASNNNVSVNTECSDEPNISISDHVACLNTSFIEKINDSNVSWTDIQGLVTDCDFNSDFGRSSYGHSISAIENNGTAANAELRDLGLLDENTNIQQEVEVYPDSNYNLGLDTIELVVPETLQNKLSNNIRDEVQLSDNGLEEINEILETHFSNDGSSFDTFEDCVGDEIISDLDCNINNTHSTLFELLARQDKDSENNIVSQDGSSISIANVENYTIQHSERNKNIEYNLPLKKREVLMSDQVENPNMACDKKVKRESKSKNKKMQNISTGDSVIEKVNPHTSGTLVAPENLEPISMDSQQLEQLSSGTGSVMSNDKPNMSISEDKQKTRLKRKRHTPNGNIKLECNADSMDVGSFEMEVEMMYNVTGGNLVKCAVCSKELQQDNWVDHCSTEHNYLAWIQGSMPLNIKDTEMVVNHLDRILRSTSPLVCSICGQKRTRASTFWKHLQQCLSVTNKVIGTPLNGKRQRRSKSSNALQCSDVDVEAPETHAGPSSASDSEPVTCGVCKWKGVEGEWQDHMCKEHGYLTWKDEQKPLDVDNIVAVNAHLKDILKQNSKLVCGKCGLERKYVKAFLKHYNNCGIKESQNEIIDTTQDASTVEQYGGLADNSVSDNEISFNIPTKRRRILTFDETDDVSLSKVKEKDEAPVKCGRCQAEVKESGWYEHIRKEHDYIAWKEGEDTFDIENATIVKRHLRAVLKQTGVLQCGICSSQLTSADGFHYHLRRCREARKNDPENTTPLRAGKKAAAVPSKEVPTTDRVKCAVCSLEMESNRWKRHLQDVHYNLAWFEGGAPLDITDHKKCYISLNDLIKLKGVLCCNDCGLKRMSAAGFYAHIITCQKTEEEIEALKLTCAVCSYRYLPQYQLVHMATHRTSEYKDKEAPPEITINTGSEDGPRKRTAALTAKANMKKLTTDLLEGQQSCKLCGHTYTVGDEHKCSKRAVRGSEDNDYKSDGSGHSESESAGESDVDSELSAEQEQEQEETVEDVEEEEPLNKEKRERDFERTDYKPGQDDAFYRDSFFTEHMKEFCSTHFTKDQLYPELECNSFEPVPSEELDQYLPPLRESCKVSLRKLCKGKIDWSTYQLFQSTEECGPSSAHTLFVGGPISAMSWVPPADRLCLVPSSQHLAVACQRDADLRGLQYDQLHAYPDLVQIWCFDDFLKNKAKFVLGLAHNYGTVWSLDWCPSGAMADLEAPTEGLRRLGLLAMACSNGSVYIVAVCHPSLLPQKEVPVYKTKPVMELRLCEGDKHDRCQATTVNWSVKRDHSTVAVGYSDGTVGLYNLHARSPMLRTTRDNVTVLYPYFDSQLTSNSVTGLAMYPTYSPERTEGVTLCVSSRRHVAVYSRLGIAPIVVTERLVCSTGAFFNPHWPTLLVPSEDLATGVLGIAWCDDRSLQRMCVGHAAAVCMHTSRLAAATQASQIILVKGLHPEAISCKKHIIGTYEMTPLHINKHAKKKADDNLEVKLEPTTYDEAVGMYGITYSSDRSFKMGHRHPEQFPLNSITHVAFCPAAKYFNRLAYAGVAGFVMVKRL